VLDPNPDSRNRTPFFAFDVGDKLHKDPRKRSRAAEDRRRLQARFEPAELRSRRRATQEISIGAQKFIAPELHPDSRVAGCRELTSLNNERTRTRWILRRQPMFQRQLLEK